MNNYTNLRKKNANSVISIVLIVLVLLEISSVAVLFSRISLWADKESGNVFPLTESTDITTVTVGRVALDGSVKLYDTSFKAEIPEKKSAASYISIINIDSTNENDEGGRTDLEVFDKNTVWTGNTPVEIFKYEYVNGENKVTVAGDGKDKLIAPGTDNKYSFTLKNTGEVSLDYKMTMNAYVTGTELKIPVVVRVIDHEGNYCLGGESKWVDVLDLSKVEKQGTLAADRYANYTLEWMWPFEGDDEYDTMLGNLATEGDLTLTVEINTYATESDDPNDPGDNPPQTGDKAAFDIIWAIIAITVATAAVFAGKKRGGRVAI